MPGEQWLTEAVQQQYQQTANTSTPEAGYGAVWGADNGYTNMTYTPGEYLNDKDAQYESFLEQQHPGSEFMEWTGNNPSLLNSPIEPMTSFDFLPPNAMATTTSPSSWNGGALDRKGSVAYSSLDRAMASPATTTFLPSDKEGPMSPTSGGGGGGSGGSKSHKSHKSSSSKSKSSHKSRSRSDAKSKSFSSSASSTSSTGSVKYSNSGHGGNHHITLRTASRKPKPNSNSNSSNSNGNGNGSSHGKANRDGFSPDSSPSPDATGDQLTSEERRARQNHNVVEKQYRNRLNAQFEWLLAVLPANQEGRDGAARNGEYDDRRMSKAEVLDLARRRIHALEQERKQLHAERKTLLENVSLMQQAVQRQHIGTATVGNAV